MKKEEICVPIHNEEELQQARETLERNGERINDICFNLISNTKFNYLNFDKEDNDWYLGEKSENQIQLSELEYILTGKYESKKQSSIEWLVSLLKTDDEKEQAKQMHREEIEQAYNEGYRCAEIDLCHDTKNDKDISEYSNASKELIEKFLPYTNKGGYYTYVEYITGIDDITNAKQCALVCVDEKIKMLNNLMSDFSLKHYTCLNELEMIKLEIENYKIQK